MQLWVHSRQDTSKQLEDESAESRFGVFVVAFHEAFCCSRRHDLLETGSCWNIASTSQCNVLVETRMFLSSVANANESRSLPPWFGNSGIRKPGNDFNGPSTNIKCDYSCFRLQALWLSLNQIPLPAWTTKTFNFAAWQSVTVSPEPFLTSIVVCV